MTLLHEYIQTDTLPSGEEGLSWFSGLVVYATWATTFLTLSTTIFRCIYGKIRAVDQTDLFVEKI